MLFELSRPMQEKGGKYNKNNDKIKLMMAYIHEHYSEKISISELAAAAYLSERECFRVFHDCRRLWNILRLTACLERSFGNTHTVRR